MRLVVSAADARRAAIELHESIDWSMGERNRISYSDVALSAAKRACEDIKVLTGSRISAEGNPMDFIAPSMWHAACALLNLTLEARLHTKTSLNDDAGCRDISADILAFRGQSQPWNIIPTRWRVAAEQAERSDRIVAALHAVLASITGEHDAIEFDLFGRVATPLDAQGIAQHHGIPTNLVDFTFDPLVALYFALARTDSQPESAIVANAPRHAVVYWSKMLVITGLANFKLRLPPVPLQRLYRQSGFFVDFGAPPATVPKMLDYQSPWMWLQENCRRIFVPREYPNAGDNTYQEQYILRDDAFLLELLETLTKADESLLTALCGSEAPPWTSLGLKSQPLWRIASDRSFTYTTDELLSYGKLIEQYLRKSTLLNMSEGPMLDPAVTLQIADNDPRILQALLDLSMTSDMRSLIPIADLIRHSLRLGSRLRAQYLAGTDDHDPTGAAPQSH